MIRAENDLDVAVLARVLATLEHYSLDYSSEARHTRLCKQSLELALGDFRSLVEARVLSVNQPFPFGRVTQFDTPCHGKPHRRKGDTP